MFTTSKSSMLIYVAPISTFVTHFYYPLPLKLPLLPKLYPKLSLKSNLLSNIHVEVIPILS